MYYSLALAIVYITTVLALDIETNNQKVSSEATHAVSVQTLVKLQNAHAVSEIR